MLKMEEFELYDRVLTGAETALELEKCARKRYLKMKMRDKLTQDIGDHPDTLTDVLRAALICYGVQAGMVTDAAVISRLNAYVGEMLAGYGGPEAIMDTLELDKAAIGRHVLAGYFTAKAAIDAATTSEEVSAIDLPGEATAAGTGG